MFKKLFSMILVLAIVLNISSAAFAQDFKELPEKYKKVLGENYVLVDIDALNRLKQDADKAEYLETHVKLVEEDLLKFKTYSQKLEEAIKMQDQHIALLDRHITAQERIIEDLQPNFWDKNKFAFGILTGLVLVGGAAYAVHELD